LCSSAGNSHIENLCAPNPDPKLHIEYFYRSEAQDLDCGLQPDHSHAHEVPSQAPKFLPPRNEGLDKLVADTNIAKKEVNGISSFAYSLFDKESNKCFYISGYKISNSMSFVL